MVFVFEISTPANTSESAKQVTRCKVARGRTYKFDLMFPPGPVGLLHVQIGDGLHQVWPTNPEADFIGDNEVIEFEDEYLIDEPPYELQVVTWNEDNTYDHVVVVRVGITELGVTPPVESTEEVVTPIELG